MSNPEPGLQRSARWHQPAIWGIVVAILAVGLVIIFLVPWRTEDQDVVRHQDPATPDATAAVPDPNTTSPQATTVPTVAP